MFGNMLQSVPGFQNALRRLRNRNRRTVQRVALLEMLPKRSVGIEIGVHLGDFSEDILNIVAPQELHLVDPWKHECAPAYRDAWYGGKATKGQTEMDKRFEYVRARFEARVIEGRVTIHRNYSSEVFKQFPNEYFDWVYIDGNHLYEYVREDLKLSFDKIKVGGLITGDDYIDGGWWNGGVKRAVDEFIATNHVELLRIQNGQFICRKQDATA